MLAVLIPTYLMKKYYLVFARLQHLSSAVVENASPVIHLNNSSIIPQNNAKLAPIYKFSIQLSINAPVLIDSIKKMDFAILAVILTFG